MQINHQVFFVWFKQGVSRPYLVTFMSFSQSIWISQLGLRCVLKAIVHRKNQYSVLRLLDKVSFSKRRFLWIWLIFPFYQDLFLLFIFLYLSFIYYFRHITFYTRGSFSIFVSCYTDNTPQYSCLKSIIGKILKSLIININFQS